MMVYLRFAQLRGSGNAKRLCANAIVAPIVSSVNVRSTDILYSSKNCDEKKSGKNEEKCLIFPRNVSFSQAQEKQKVTSVSMCA